MPRLAPPLALPTAVRHCSNAMLLNFRVAVQCSVPRSFEPLISQRFLGQSTDSAYRLPSLRVRPVTREAPPIVRSVPSLPHFRLPLGQTRVRNMKWRDVRVGAHPYVGISSINLGTVTELGWDIAKRGSERGISRMTVKNDSGPRGMADFRLVCIFSLPFYGKTVAPPILWT